MGRHIVQAGDNAPNIASRFHISVQALRAANPDVNIHNLQSRQVLNIPNGSTKFNSSRTYTVQAGDIAFTVSGKFGISVQALQAVNPGVDFNNLRVGQVLRIPS